MSPLRILVIDRKQTRSDDLVRSLRSEGYDVVTAPTGELDLPATVRSLEPEVIIIDTGSPDRDMLEDTRRVGLESPRPVVMFVDESDRETTEAAIHAGVAAYVVNGARPERVRHVLDVAISRFQQFQDLKHELAVARTSLDERKIIDRAKGVLMDRREINEAEAYRTLRQMAMNRNMRLVDVARAVLDVANLI